MTVHDRTYGLKWLLIAGLAISVLLAGCRRTIVVAEGDLALAQTAMLDGDMRQARNLLDAFLDDHPQSLTAWFNLGLVCLELGDLTAAADAFNRALEINPGITIAWEMLGMTYLRAHNFDGASEVLSQLNEPSEIGLTVQGMAVGLAGQPEAARHYFERALKKNRFYAPALYNLAVLHRDVLETPVEALAMYRKFRETEPRHPLAENTDNGFLALSLEMALPGVDFTLGDRQPDRSVADNDLIDDLAEVEEKPHPLSELLQKAESHRTRGDTDAALLMLNEAVRNYPDQADALWQLAIFYDKELHATRRAEGLYETFFKMFPDDPRAGTIRSSLSEQLRADHRSEATGDHYFRKGLEHYNRREWDLAIEAYNRALKLDPTSSSCAYNLGLAYKAKNDLDAAAAAFQQALGLEPNMTKSLYMLGLTEIHRGQKAEALPHLNRLISVKPDFAKAHYLLGTVYLSESRPDTAAFHFERFLRIAPDDSLSGQVGVWLEQYRR